MKISCEGGHGRHADDDFEFLPILICLNTTISNSRSDLIPDWVLSVVCGRNEELILDIDEVLAVANDLDISVCNRVLDD